MLSQEFQDSLLEKHVFYMRQVHGTPSIVVFFGGLFLPGNDVNFGSFLRFGGLILAFCRLLHVEGEGLTNLSCASAFQTYKQDDFLNCVCNDCVFWEALLTS